MYNDGLTPQDLKRLRLLTIIVKIIGSIFIAGFFIAVLIIMFIGDSWDVCLRSINPNNNLMSQFALLDTIIIFDRAKLKQH